MNFPTYKDIELFYSWGCYTKADIRRYVELGVLTETEYEKMTGEAFS